MLGGLFFRWSPPALQLGRKNRPDPPLSLLFSLLYTVAILRQVGLQRGGGGGCAAVVVVAAVVGVVFFGWWWRGFFSVGGGAGRHVEFYWSSR